MTCGGLRKTVRLASASLTRSCPRAVFEERLLKQPLPGYAENVRRVCFRLIPGVW